MKNNKIFKTSLLIILVTFMSLFPIDTMAKELICNYNYDGNNLQFTLNNNKLTSPIKDGQKYNDKSWYKSANFDESFISSSKSSLCPTRR